VQPAAPNGFMFEKFIFDVLPDAQGLVNLAFDRREEFAPVKNAAGADSPASCQAALTAKWARWLAAAGIDLPVNAEGVPPWPIEIDPLFADSAAALAARRPLAVDRSRAIWLHE
jgi:UDP-N-acetylglucosamine/UDP-N-acetylgalactosamine diphosphorylase